MTKLLVIIFAILPFQFALSPLTGFDVALVRVLIALAVLLWSARFLATGRIRYAHAPLTALIVLFLTLAIASVLVATDTHWFARKALFLLNFFALFFLITGAPSPTLSARLLRIATASGALAALVALAFWGAQFLVSAEVLMAFWRSTIAPLFLGRTVAHTLATYSSAYVNIAGTDYLRAVGLFPDPHVAAYFFELLLPPAIALALTACAWRARLAWTLAVGALLAAALATFTRGAYVALAVGALATLAIALVRRGAITRRRLGAGIGALLVLAAAVSFTPLGARLSATRLGADSSVTARIAIWRDALGTIGAHPLLGVGLGNYPLTVAPLADYRDPYYAHNLYLDIAVETGVAAALLWIGIILTAIRALLRTRAPLATAAAIALIILSTHNLFDSMLFSVHVLPLALLLLAFSTQAQPATTSRNTPHSF